MADQVDSVEVGVILYPEALSSAIFGLTEMCAVANHIAAGHEGMKRPRLRVTHWRDDGAGVACVYDSEGKQGGKPHFLIAPPSLGAPISKEAAAPYARWLKARHGEGGGGASLCAGCFFWGAGGVVGGRASTTHWFYADGMAQRFTDTHVDSDKLMIDDGDIITAGGFMAWTDLGLRIVHRVLGPTVMMETARFMLVDPPGREQRYYSTFIPKLHHGDAAILKVQHWLQKTGAKEVDVAQMAKKAGMEERTFLRRFTKATGMRPTEYCQHLRVGKGREMLEFTKQSVEQVAWAAGYEDPGAFRKVFFKVTGLTPGEYRGRFGMAG